MLTLRPATDARAAEWVLQGVRGFGDGVGSLVPVVFESYARVFHPASLGDQDVRWDDVARANNRGHEEYLHFAEEFMATWADDFAINLDTVRAYGDAVMVRVVFSGHSRAGGVEISERMVIVDRVQDGLITRIEDFADRQEALRAAGVSE